jgi:hypothetical protein
VTQTLSLGWGWPSCVRAQAGATAYLALRPHGMTHADRSNPFGDGDAASNGDGKEMAWSELIGWMVALTRPTPGF